MGVGYRKLVGTAAIIGVNGFIDNKDGTQTAFTFNPSGVYQRYSLGLELKTAAFDVSANIYRPMSKGIIKEYKVLKGWDITTKGAIPLAPALSLGVNMYTFDGVDDAMVKGNKLIAEYKPNRTITLRGEYDKPNGGAAKTNIFMGFKWDFATAAQTPSQATKSAAVWHKRYDKVERQYDVKIAKAKAKTTPTLGNNISSADMQSTDNTPVRSGDGKTQATAYGLVSGKIYNVKDFLGTVPSGVTPTVKVEKISGNDDDFQFKNGNTNVDILTNVRYGHVLVDQAGKDEAVLQMTFSAAGYQDRIVFVKTQAIASLDIAGNTRLSAREWGNAVINADYGLPTSVQVNGQTTNVSYTFAFKSSTVGGVAGNADISTATGAIASGKITDSGDIVITVTRAEVAGKLASATKDITIPISKKTRTPALADKADIKDVNTSTPIASGDGSNGSPFELEDGNTYNIKDFVKATPNGLSNPTVKVYWDNNQIQHGNFAADFSLINSIGTIQSGVGIAYTNGAIKDSTDFKTGIIRIEFTYTNPDADKYEVTPTLINVYIKISDGS